MEGMEMNFYDVYKCKKVLVTGHTGFKGSWLCEWLLSLGAEVYGFALEPPTQPALFDQLGLDKRIVDHTVGDIRDRKVVETVVCDLQPDFIFHLAAQPLVRLSYSCPVETFETNVMGTVNLLDACRLLDKKCNVICVTTDKCYENTENGRAYVETDPMGGYDPYSCSKGCDELVIASYRRSFFNSSESKIWLASARAGNVIGGGDWSMDRIVPDAIRALAQGESIPVRNKNSTRPWQHVLDPLCGYLTLGSALAKRERFSEVCGGFNFGPDPNANRTVENLVEAMLGHMNGSWVDVSEPNAVHEATLLNLDIRKAAEVLGWKPTWGFRKTIFAVCEWYEGVLFCEKEARKITLKQIKEFEEWMS